MESNECKKQRERKEKKFPWFLLFNLLLLNQSLFRDATISKMDPVKYIFKKPALTGRIAQWQVLLFEFDNDYVTQKARKGSALVDYLAYVKKLMEFFDDISFHHIPREEKLMEFFDDISCHSSIHVSANPSWRLAVHRVQMSQQSHTLLLDRRGATR